MSTIVAVLIVVFVLFFILIPSVYGMWLFIRACIDIHKLIKEFSEIYGKVEDPDKRFR